MKPRILRCSMFTYLKVVFVIMVIFIPFTPVIASSITNDMVERTVKAFFENEVDSVKVNGIQDLPQQNSAKASINLVNVRFKSVLGPEKFTGSAVVLFVKYTDGRWVLDAIAFDNNDRTNWTGKSFPAQ